MEVDRAEQRRVVDRFLTALRTGDLQGLMDALAPDAVLIADGGGLVAAVRQPVDGAKKIVNLLGGFARIAPTAVVEAGRPQRRPGRPQAPPALQEEERCASGFWWRMTNR